MSQASHCRPNRSAAMAVVAQPANTSSTTSPGLLLAVMMRSYNANGFWVE